MKNIRVFLSEKFRFLEVKFSMYLNRRVFVMSLTFSMRQLIHCNMALKWALVRDQGYKMSKFVLIYSANSRLQRFGEHT